MTDTMMETQAPSIHERVQKPKDYEFLVDREQADEAAGRVVEIDQIKGDRSEDYKISYTKSMKDIIKANRELEEAAKSIKTLKEAEKYGIETLRITLKRLTEDYQRQLNDGNPKWYEIVDRDTKRRTDILGDTRGVVAHLENIVKALRAVDQGERTKEAQAFTDELYSITLNRIDPSVLQGLTEREVQRIVMDEMREQVKLTLSSLQGTYNELRDISGKNVAETYGKDREKFYKDVLARIKNLQNTKFIDIPVSSTDSSSVNLDRLVFEHFTTAKDEWFDEVNPKNMESAIILAAKFAGGSEWQPGGEYALYDYTGEEGDINHIRVNLHNIQLFIHYRVREHMWFQGPDDQINALEAVRLFETPYRSVTLFEFLVYDVSKYKQQRIETGTRVNDDYYWFLMYEAYHLSSIEKNFNFGTEAHNSMTDEEMWLDWYKKNLRGSKMSNSDRGLRHLRSLSRKNIEEIMSHGEGSFAAWFDKSFETAAGEKDWGSGAKDVGELGADGELGQAISDVTTLYKYVQELADNSWDIKKHLDAIDEESEHDRVYGKERRELRKLISSLTKKDKDTIRRRLEAEKRLEELDLIKAKIQYKQNFFFRALGGREEILHFFKILTNSYLRQELGWSSSRDVRSVVEKSGDFMILDVLQGTSKISASDRDIIIGELVNRGMNRGLLDKFGSGALTDQEFGSFFEGLFNLQGNRYKKKNLNLYTETGTVAKGPLSSMFNRVVEKFMLDEKYKDRLEETEVLYAVESGRKMPEWMTEGLQNDTSVSGNKFWGRIAHPEEYFTKNTTKLPAGIKETLPIIKSSQSMWNGVVVDALIRDVDSGDEWWETIYYGDFIQRSMNRGKERIIRASFADQSMSVFFTRRVNAPIKMFKYRKDTKTWDTFNPGKAFLGYVSGAQHLSDEVIEEFLAGRLALSDFLFQGKYPILHKRLVREWEKVRENGEDKIRGITTTTEHAMLGDNVFLMEDALLQVPDIKDAIEKGEWSRGELLEAMTELTFIGSTLRTRAYEILRPSLIRYLNPFTTRKAFRERRTFEEQGEDQPQLTTDALNMVRFVLTKSKLGKMGVGKIHVDANTGKIVNEDTGEEVSGEELNRKLREEMEYKGQRYNEAVVHAMYKLVMGVPYGRVMRKELKEDVGGGAGGLLWTLLTALFAESFAIIKKEAKL